MRGRGYEGRREFSKWESGVRGGGWHPARWVSVGFGKPEQPAGRDDLSPLRERRVDSTAKFSESRVSGGTADGDGAHGQTATKPTTVNFMAHTYTLNLVHVVFSTKNRVPMIRDLAGLVKNLRGIARNKNLEVLTAGGHIESCSPVAACVADACAERRRSRPKGELIAIHERDGWPFCMAGRICGHQRQSFTGADVADVHRQSGNPHHAKRTYEEELRALLDKAGVKYEKEYLV